MLYYSILILQVLAQPLEVTYEGHNLVVNRQQQNYVCRNYIDWYQSIAQRWRGLHPEYTQPFEPITCSLRDSSCSTFSESNLANDGVLVPPIGFPAEKCGKSGKCSKGGGVQHCVCAWSPPCYPLPPQPAGDLCHRWECLYTNLTSLVPQFGIIYDEEAIMNLRINCERQFGVWNLSMCRCEARHPGTPALLLTPLTARCTPRSCGPEAEWSSRHCECQPRHPRHSAPLVVFQCLKYAKAEEYRNRGQLWFTERTESLNHCHSTCRKNEICGGIVECAGRFEIVRGDRPLDDYIRCI
jgi:hypothetical protein